jgi:Nif-specific regulatory protein
VAGPRAAAALAPVYFSGNMTRIAAPIDLLDTGVPEDAALEAIVSVLTGPGTAQARLDQAVELARQRLQSIRGDPAAEPEGMLQPASKRASPALVGDSEAMRAVYEAIRRVSHSAATVLLRGESGTGKELVAKAIHLEGPRSRSPFVRLHCAAVTETLLESELFGHERGAFTGAVEMRKGRFELAEGGTLFLDEVGDIPLPIQVKLLRVLQDKCFERVGGSRLLAVDVRVIAATHRDLEAMVRAGTFREDLYYRLNVVPIILPPLREREGDVPLLIEHFLARSNRENRRRVTLSPELRTLMARYHWPGNVRELQNCVERLVVLAEQEHVTFHAIPSSLKTYFSDIRQVTEAGRAAQESGSVMRAERLADSLQEIERKRLVEALERTGWVQAKAARALGLTPRQVAYKIKKFQLMPASLA